MLDYQPVTLDLNNGEPVAQAIIPVTKRQKNALRKATGLRHFTPIERIGYNPRLLCWCGSQLELSYVRDGMTLSESTDLMTSELNAFCREHEVCPAPSQEIAK